ncbi:hypothetical protein IKF02_00050 [Candidatus Saccharibacteria bacterium]|nr:hypothetical protein [Candidatus Saccharibacteria bacterium]
MAKSHIYKKPRNGDPIEVTARQLTELYEKHEGILASRQYKDLKNMVLVDSSVRDAKRALREFDDETLLGTWGKEIRYGYGKRIYFHLDREDKDKYYFSLAYIPRALNNRDVNEAILRMYFVRRWWVDKRFLWAEPIDITPSYGHGF